MNSLSERDGQILARVSWLQSLLSHRIVPESFAKHLYQRCCAVAQYPYSESAYRSMVDEASKQLSMVDLEIRSSREQVSGKRMLALVNTKNDNVIQNATRYSPLEISFIKKLVEEIFKARREAYSIPALEAVRLGSKLRTHMTRDATEELLKNLVDHRWIDYSADGIYTLSTRSLLELGNYLQNEFGDEYFHTCTHCKDLVTLGIGCGRKKHGCNIRYHLHCARSTIASAVDDDDALLRIAGFSCPACRSTWKSRPIGPKALNLSSSGDHDGFISSQGESSQTAATSRNRRRRQASHDDDEDEGEHDEDDETVEQQPADDGNEDEEDEEEAGQPQRRPTQVKPEPGQQGEPSQRRVRSRAAPAEDEEESDEEEPDVKPRKRAR
ncbi:uncharacterized protein UDID_06554 [Ustilago sp. UG-2017a]|nr:uncharacterized protein UDID_06554 [Ustilago sp. UG-2017a]